MITYHREVYQGSEEWLELRRGILTASEMKLIVTTTLKQADNEKERAHLYELLAQRISGFVEPQYISDDMLRGQEDEIRARSLYAEKYCPVEEIGFVTNDKWGFTIGYSPDGLVGTEGQIEAKSRRQKFQVQTLIENFEESTIPSDFAIQIQTGLAVTERQWCDFITYSGGLHMATIRVFPDPIIQERIIAIANDFEKRLAQKHELYRSIVRQPGRLIPTERTVQQEITV